MVTVSVHYNEHTGRVEDQRDQSFALARGKAVTTFPEMKKEFDQFPVVAGYFMKGGMKCGGEIKDRRAWYPYFETQNSMK